jgi:hypothetical protein
VLRVFAEGLALEWVDPVADEAGQGHAPRYPVARRRWFV